MRNVWKGLVVGGLTGVCAGVVLDALATASDRAHRVGRMVADRAPVVADRLTEVAERGAARIGDVDLPSTGDVARSLSSRAGDGHS